LKEQVNSHIIMSMTTTDVIRTGMPVLSINYFYVHVHVD